ncbi:MAG TPA: carbohydrate-binding family 9-like protein, partial [Pyrinomonadaceae bacterium]|nr:carbohydrate-binding family 9-like protein [Pyrinomonadaceae bacterium]
DRKTLGLWDRDVCEIFLAPDAAHPERYFEFEAAPTGEWLDLGILVTPTGRETDWEYHSGMQVAARIEPQSVEIAIRIPWSDAIPKPVKADVWRANVFRCVGPEAPERYLAWRPTRTPEPNYHVPEAFGMLRFE